MLPWVVILVLSECLCFLNARNNQNDSPLHIAARCGHTNVVKALIDDFNCNPNETGFEGRTILHEACLNGHVELAETLIVGFGLSTLLSTMLPWVVILVLSECVFQHNADLNTRNNQNDSPHIAARLDQML